MHDLVPVLERLQAGKQPGTSLRGAFDDVFGVDRVQGGEAGRHRQHVLAERGAVHDGAVHLVEHRLDDVRLGDDGADGDVSTRQRLGHRDDVGDDAPLLEGEERAGSPEPGLHLVDGEERAVPVAQVGGLAQVVLRGDEHALALDRLDDERGDVTGFQLATQRVEIAERDALATGEQITEPVSKLAPTVQRQGTRGQSVERVVGEQDARAARRAARELEHRLDRLGAAVGEEAPVRVVRHTRDEGFGE